MVYERRTVASAICAFALVKRAEFLFKCLFVSVPKIYPVRQAIHVQAYDALLRYNAASIAFNAHKLNAVKSIDKVNKILPAPKPVEIAACIGHIELSFHFESILPYCNL